MHIRSRNKDEKLERREAILDAAELAFIEQRFDKTSMDAIARSAKLSRALLYVYFRDKEDIHVGLSVRAANTLYELMKKYVSECDKGVQEMYAIGKAYLYFYRHQQDYFRILTLSAGMRPAGKKITADSTHAEKTYAEADERILQLMVNSVEKALNDGSLILPDNASPVSIALYMRGSLHGVIMLQDGNNALFKAHNLDTEQWLEQSLNLLARGLSGG